MNAVIHDRAGNRLHVPPTIPRLDVSQREFMRQQFAAAAQHQERLRRAILDFIDRLPETRT